MVLYMLAGKLKSRARMISAALFVSVFSLQFCMPLVQLTVVSMASVFPESPTLTDLASSPGCYQLLNNKTGSNTDESNQHPALLQATDSQHLHTHCPLCYNLQNRKGLYLSSASHFIAPQINSAARLESHDSAYNITSYAGDFPARAPPAV